VACKSVMIDGVEYVPVPDTSDNIISIKGVTYVKMYPAKEQYQDVIREWLNRTEQTTPTSRQGKITC